MPDEAPAADTLTPYDEARLRLYLRLLDAEAESANWREVVRIVLSRDPINELSLLVQSFATGAMDRHDQLCKFASPVA